MPKVSGVITALAAVVLLLAAAPAQAQLRMAPFDPARLGARPAVVHDRVIAAPGAGLATPTARVPPNAFEGRFPVDASYSVRLLLSPVYQPDAAVLQSVASFMGTLVHGGEMSGVSVFLGTPGEVALVCGSGAEACFNADENLMIVPAAPPPSGIAREEIMAHEYGHAVANGRSNHPFPAFTFGTKRWATYERVCPRYLRVLTDPTAKVTYRNHPGEAFADSYRVLNGGNAALFVFDRSYLPNPTDLRLIREDVLDPWHERPPLVLTGRFPPGDHPRVRRLTVTTPLDGLIQIRLQEPPGADFDVEVKGIGRPAPAPREDPQLRATTAARRDQDQAGSLICGTRKFAVTVRRRSGSGRYTLRIQRPTG